MFQHTRLRVGTGAWVTDMKQFHLPHFDPPSHDDLWEFDLFGNGDEISSCYSETPVYRDATRPNMTDDLMAEGKHVDRSRDSSKWRCCNCNSEFWHWDASLQSWVCFGCGKTEFYDTTRPQRLATDEGCCVYVPNLGSDSDRLHHKIHLPIAALQVLSSPTARVVQPTPL